MITTIFTTIAAFSNGNFVVQKSCDQRHFCYYEIKPNKQFQCEFLKFSRCTRKYSEPEACGRFAVIDGDFNNIKCCDTDFGPMVVGSNEQCPMVLN